MLKRTLALVLMMAVFGLPAMAVTVQEELDAYWEKANPIYSQIEALAARQDEIYEEFNVPLSCEVTDFLEDGEYEAYIQSLNVLSEDELKTLLDVNSRIIALSDEIDALNAQLESSENTEDPSVLESLIHIKTESISDLADSVAGLDDRVREAEEIAYVNGLPNLDDAARKELIGMYESQRDLENQLLQLESTLSDEAVHNLYGE